MVWRGDRELSLLERDLLELQVAQQLANTRFEVMLIDRKNYHIFAPLLHQVATAELEPQRVIYPIRRWVRQSRIRFVMTKVEQIDLQEQTAMTDRTRFAYDFFVVATGSTT